jgi:GT2 family glycosyltransferase
MSILIAVVVNHRTPDETLLAVDSLRSAHRPPDRIVVVDNGSMDGSVARLEAAGVETLALPRNLGFAGGANTGIRQGLVLGAASLLLVNSDARLHPACVGALERALVGDVGIAGPSVLMHDAPDRIESAGIRYAACTGRMRLVGAGRRLDRPGGRNDGPSRTVDGIAGTVMLIRRDVLETVGDFDEGFFLYFEDLDLCLRARRAGFRCVHVPEALAWHRGAHSIGRRSAERIYWATRGHLRLAKRAHPLPAPLGWLRAAVIVSLGAANVLMRRPVPVAAGVWALARGAWDHARRA